MKEGLGWFFQLFTGLFLVALLGVHMLGMHMDTLLPRFGMGYKDPLVFQEVLKRGHAPLFVAFYVVFLGLALYHGFYGLRAVLMEVWASSRTLSSINMLVWSLGLFLFFLGTAVSVGFFLV
jgi:succinate dehydrogenase / fumarate reductase membrane anchor subunit